MKRTILLLSLFAAAALAAVEYTFWQGAAPLYDIKGTSSPDAREKEAIELLKNSFAAMSKADIAKNAPKGKKVTICIGSTAPGQKVLAKAGKIEHDGFIIAPVDSQTLVITGGSSLGTLFGVMEFLERYAGVMWVWPGKYGTVMPIKETFSADVKFQKEDPAFSVRQLGVDASMAHFFRFAVRNSEDERAQYSHNINKTMPPSLWEKHPEYFNMLDGVRRKPVKMKRQACTSNADVVNIFINGAKNYFQRFPHKESFSVAQSDGGHFCECPQCRALDVPGVKGVTDRYFTFANQVADGIKEAYPDKFIASLAYGDGTQEPPAKITLRPNVIPCLVIPSMTHPVRSVEAWAKKASRLYAYFHLHGRDNPKLGASVFGNYLRFLKKNRVTGICGELHPALPKLNGSYEIDGPRSWIFAKLIWNPERDSKALLKEFCQKFYGSAAAPMERYYQILEKAWGRLENVYDFRCDYDNPGYFLYTPQDMEQMVACVREAEKLSSSPEVKGRIEALKSRLFPRASHYVFAGMKANPTPALVAERIEKARLLNPKNPLLHLPADEAEAVDRAFLKLSPAQLAPCIDKTPELAFFDRRGSKRKNICRNPGFEIRHKGKAPAGADWKKIDAQNWSSWLSVYTRGKVGISTTNARSGKRCAVFEGCQAASVNYVLPAVPGKRFAVSAWFKGKGGTISANFKDKDKKWLHKSAIVHAGTLSAGKGEYEKITFTFVVPEKATQCLLLFGTRDQGANDKLYLDDVEITEFGK